MRIRIVIPTVLATMAAMLAVGCTSNSPKEPPAAAAQSPSVQPTEDERGIAYLRQQYGVHFDHPSNTEVKTLKNFLPYTNVWASIEFQGMKDGKPLRPVVRTYGNITIDVPAEPEVVRTLSEDRRGKTIVQYAWNIRATYGPGVTYYLTMYNDGRTVKSVNGWGALD